jgi:UDP-2,3-diacylglucosamine hydrolase
MEIKLNEKATYVNLGDWITHFTYGMFDGQKVVLKKWETS